MAKNAFFGEKRGFFDFLTLKIGISDPKMDPQTPILMILTPKIDQIDHFGQSGKMTQNPKVVFSTIFLHFFEKSENEQKSTFFQKMTFFAFLVNVIFWDKMVGANFVKLM